MNLHELSQKSPNEWKNLSAEEKTSLQKDLKNYWSQTYDSIANMSAGDLENISEADLNRVFTEATASTQGNYDASKIDKTKVLTFVNFAKRMKKDDFVTHMTTGELPPVKLNEHEMELVRGGLAWEWILGSVGCGLASGGIGIAVCAGVMIVAAMDEETGVY